MTTITNEIRLVVLLEGGVIQAVYSDSDTPIRFAIQDLDIDVADQDEMATLDDGTEFVGHIEPILRNDSHIARVFAAFGEDVVVTDKQQEDYVAKHGLICPNCGSDQIESTGPVEIYGGLSVLVMSNAKTANRLGLISTQLLVLIILRPNSKRKLIRHS
jgi:hypothetical protein